MITILELSRSSVNRACIPPYLS